MEQLSHVFKSLELYDAAQVFVKPNLSLHVEELWQVSRTNQ